MAVRSTILSRMLTSAFFLSLSAVAVAGNLTIGKPTVDQTRYTFPILLNADNQNVSALDFHLQYDPAVFRPISATTGTSALQSNKTVTANSPNPGEYIVVMMGLNQAAVPQGEVARIVMERVGPATGASALNIANPTLSDPNGQEIPTEGTTSNIELGVDTSPPSSTLSTSPAATPPVISSTTTSSKPAASVATAKPDVPVATARNPAAPVFVSNGSPNVPAANIPAPKGGVVSQNRTAIGSPASRTDAPATPVNPSASTPQAVSRVASEQPAMPKVFSAQHTSASAGGPAKTRVASAEPVRGSLAGADVQTHAAAHVALVKASHWPIGMLALAAACVVLLVLLIGFRRRIFPA